MVNTRPDIPFPVTKLARYAQTRLNATSPLSNVCTSTSKAARDAAFNSNLPPDPLIGFVDADWAGTHADSCLSTSGFVFRLAGGPVCLVVQRE